MYKLINSEKTNYRNGGYDFMHGDFRDVFVRIHMLYHADEQSISIGFLSPELQRHGYNLSDSEIQRNIDHLVDENYLTQQGSGYVITDAGKQELADTKRYLKELSKEVLSV